MHGFNSFLPTDCTSWPDGAVIGLTSSARHLLSLTPLPNSRRHGPLRDADLRDLQHLGVHADTLPEGMLDLERLIRANEPMELDRVLQTLYGLSAREHQTWLPLIRADRWVEDTATFDEDLRQEAEAIRLTPL